MTTPPIAGVVPAAAASARLTNDGGAAATYDSLRAVNWSTLRNMATSPLLYRWRLDNPQPRTAALTIGSAIHCLLLEPGKFDARYAEYDGRRAGKDWATWQEDHPGVESLKPAEMERVVKSVEAVRAHKVATRLLAGCRHEEVTTWTDAETGLACKGRLDAIGPSYLVDLKSTRDVSHRKFSRSVSDYAIHGQLAFYGDGAVTARKLPADAELYVIAVQSAAPYDVGVYSMSPATVVAGRNLYRSLLHRLIQCEAAGWWPGACPDLEPLELPPWAEGQSVNTEDEEF